MATVIVTLADVHRAIDEAGPWPTFDFCGPGNAAAWCWQWIQREYGAVRRVLAPAEAGVARADVARRLVTEWRLAGCPVS